MISKTLNRTTIICPRCRKDLLIADSEKMAGYNGDDVIMAEDFQSIVNGWRDPQVGDVTNCPHCGSDYGQAIREAWMNLRSGFIVREWDE